MCSKRRKNSFDTKTCKKTSREKHENWRAKATQKHIPGREAQSRTESKKKTKGIAGRAFSRFSFSFSTICVLEVLESVRSSVAWGGRLTWIHFVAWAAGWRLVGLRIFARGLPSTAPDRQTDQHLTPFSLNFPSQLNFQFFTTFVELWSKIWFVFGVETVFGFSKFWCQTIAFRVRKFSRTHRWCLFFAAAASFLFQLIFVFFACF